YCGAFKTILDSKLGELKSELIQEQDCLKRKIKEDVTLKFKGEGNRIQYTFNEELLDTVNKLSKFIPNSNTQAYRLVLDITDKIKSRNKKIRIADSSPAGWGTVREYEANAVASDSEDERKIRQAETRAIRTSKEKSKSRQQPYPKNPPRQQPAESYGNPAYAQHYQPSQGVSLAQSTCATTASNKATGEKTVLFSPASGHPTATPQPTRSSKVQPELHSSVIVNDKYLDTINDQFSTCFLDNDHIESFLEQVQYFENCQSYDKFKGVKGYKPVEVLSELKFWLENVTMINYRKLGHYSKSSVVIYSDASNIAAGAYTVELKIRFSIRCGRVVKRCKAPH
ncbi:Hypothetical predicted protein, partial [Mytilus galloprovincialis]